MKRLLLCALSLLTLCSSCSSVSSVDPMTGRLRGQSFAVLSRKETPVTSTNSLYVDFKTNGSMLENDEFAISTCKALYNGGKNYAYVMVTADGRPGSYGYWSEGTPTGYRWAQDGWTFDWQNGWQPSYGLQRNQ